MKKNHKISSIFEYLAFASGSLWFGAYIARLITTYQLFEPAEFTLMSFVNISNLAAIMQVTYPLVNLTFFTYLFFMLCFTIFLFMTNLKLKENGWLFIVSMIIYLTFPFEVVLLAIDYKLMALFISEQFASSEILKLIIERLTILSSFPIILLLSYLTIPYFLIFRPFTLKSKNEN